MDGQRGCSGRGTMGGEARQAIAQARQGGGGNGVGVVKGWVNPQPIQVQHEDR